MPNCILRAQDSVGTWHTFTLQDIIDFEPTDCSYFLVQDVAWRLVFSTLEVVSDD